MDRSLTRSHSTGSRPRCCCSRSTTRSRRPLSAHFDRRSSRRRDGDKGANARSRHSSCKFPALDAYSSASCRTASSPVQASTCQLKRKVRCGMEWRGVLLTKARLDGVSHRCTTPPPRCTPSLRSVADRGDGHPQGVILKRIEAPGPHSDERCDESTDRRNGLHSLLHTCVRPYEQIDESTVFGLDPPL